MRALARALNLTSVALALVLLRPATADADSRPDAGAQANAEPPSPPDEAPAADTREQEQTPSRPRGHAGAARRTHRVASGDTLSGLAARYGVKAADIAQANGLGPEASIRVGQELVIPSPGERIRVGVRTHTVESGETLGKIARQYGVSIDAITKASRRQRGKPLKIGERLVIPPPSDPQGTRSAAAAPQPAEREEPERAPSPRSAAEPGMQRINVPGAPPALYYEPTGPGRLSLRPVIMYLHGRGADPERYCRRWASVARRFGWVVCPQGPEDRGGGRRGWANNWVFAHRIVLSTLNALRTKYGRRVQLYGNTLIGFSEGAFIAMNIGVHEPRAFNRWLILGADSDYWGPVALSALSRNHERIRRVYLITGGRDSVVEEAEKVRRQLKQHGVPVRVSTPQDMAHEVELEAKGGMYKAALHWLEG